MSAEIKRYEVWVADRELPDDMLMVTLRDHLASHALDEAVERAAFEDAWSNDAFPLAFIEDYDLCRVVWLACAKSRAKRFGGAK